MAQPKLSVITDEISQDFAHALDVAVELGVSAVELRTLWQTNIVDLSDQEVASAIDLLKARGLDVNGIASPFLKVGLHPQRSEQRPIGFFMDERSHQEHFAILRHSLDLARRFECPFVRTFSFWRDADSLDEDWDEVVNHLRRAADEAGRAGITLALENESTCVAATGAEARRMLDAVRSSHLRLIWDPANALCAGEVPYPDGYSQARSFIVNVHAKDASFQTAEDQECVHRLLGEGSVDWSGQIGALLADGYNGYITVETHPIAGLSPEDATRRNFATLRDLLARDGA